MRVTAKLLNDIFFIIFIKILLIQAVLAYWNSLMGRPSLCWTAAICELPSVQAFHRRINSLVIELYRAPWNSLQFCFCTSSLSWSFDVRFLSLWH